MFNYEDYLFNSLKVHTSTSKPFADVALEFPMILSNVFRSFVIKHQNYTLSMCMNNMSFFTFRNRISTAIYNNAFDYLDDITLTFLSSNKYPFLCSYLTLTFSEEDTLKFVNICNSFKGKQWDDIIDPFVDALYELMKTGYLCHGN